MKSIWNPSISYEYTIYLYTSYNIIFIYTIYIYTIIYQDLSVTSISSTPIFQLKRHVLTHARPAAVGPAPVEAISQHTAQDAWDDATKSCKGKALASPLNWGYTPTFLIVYIYMMVYIYMLYIYYCIYICYIVYIYNIVYPSPLKVLHREGSGRPPRHCSHSAGSRRAERRRRAMALHPLHLTAFSRRGVKHTYPLVI